MCKQACRPWLAMAGSIVAAHADERMVDESSADLVGYRQVGRLNPTIGVVTSIPGGRDCREMIICIFFRSGN